MKNRKKKLEGDVNTVRRLYERCALVGEIAQRFKVHPNTVLLLARTEGWKRFHPHGTHEEVRTRRAAQLTREQVALVKKCAAIKGATHSLVCDVVNAEAKDAGLPERCTVSNVISALEERFPYDRRSLMTLDEHLQEIALEASAPKELEGSRKVDTCPAPKELPEGHVGGCNSVCPPPAECIELHSLGDTRRLRREIIDELIAIFQRVRDE